MKKLTLAFTLLFASQMFVACTSQAKIEKERQQQVAEAQRLEAERVYQRASDRFNNWQANFDADETIESSKAELDTFWEAQDHANVISQARVVNSNIEVVEAKLRDQQEYEVSKTESDRLLEELKTNKVDKQKIKTFKAEIDQSLQLSDSQEYSAARETLQGINERMAIALEEQKAMKEKSDTYVVQAKDTLWSIAEKHPITADRLLWPYLLKINLSTIKTADGIQAGQTLIIERGSDEEMEKARAHAIKREGKTREERIEEDRAYLNAN